MKSCSPAVGRAFWVARAEKKTRYWTSAVVSVYFEDRSRWVPARAIVLSGKTSLSQQVPFSVLNNVRYQASF
eukprot:1606352-Pyramimonas_sp.AAC.1